MAKVQRNWGTLCADLKTALDGSKLSLQQLSKQSGVSYHALRRFKQRGISNRSKNAKTLCTFFNIPTETQVEVTPEKNGTIMGALKESWDGSHHQAELIARLIRSAKGFIVQKRKYTQ